VNLLQTDGPGPNRPLLVKANVGVDLTRVPIGSRLSPNQSESYPNDVKLFALLLRIRSEQMAPTLSQSLFQEAAKRRNNKVSGQYLLPRFE
jgi:hypothetical protein